MEVILLIICLAITTLIGWSILNIVFYKSRPLVLLERLSLAYGLGMGAVTLAMFLFYFFKIRLNIFNLLLPWIPVAIFGMFFIRPDSLSVSQQREKPPLFEKFLFCVVEFRRIKGIIPYVSVDARIFLEFDRKFHLTAHICDLKSCVLNICSQVIVDEGSARWIFTGKEELAS